MDPSPQPPPATPPPSPPQPRWDEELPPPSRAEEFAPPWRREDLFRSAPRDGSSGVLHDGRLERVEPDRLPAWIESGALLVWTPQTPWLAVPAQIPELHAAVLARTRAAALRRMRSSAWQGAVFLVLAILQSWKSPDSGPSWGWFLFLGLGLIPFLWAALELRTPDVARVDWDARAAEDRFALWIGMQRTRVTHALVGLLAVIFLLQLATHDTAIEVAGVRRDLVLDGDWPRLLLSGLVHGGVVHFLLNGSTLLVLGRFIEPLLGGARLLVIFAVTVVAASAASIAWSPDSLAVGASGGLFGCMGAFVAFGWRGRALLPRRVFRAIAIVIALNLALGWIGREFIDNAAHVGGLLAGLVCGSLVGGRGFVPPLPASRAARVGGTLAASGILLAAALVVVRVLGS
jgi:membrane associated rhomboid family serine protease